MPCRVVISAAQRSDPGKTRENRGLFRRVVRVVRGRNEATFLGGFQTNGNLKILQKWQKINAETSIFLWMLKGQTSPGHV
jgi:hypothetical protein